jgi:hypothetical protein
MRIPDELQECVCFVEARWLSGAAEVGTAFFVGVPLDAPLGSGQSWFHYAVSAQHCIAGRKKTQEEQGGPAEMAALLINQRGGGRVRCRTRVADWLFHGTADVAVLCLRSSAFTMQPSAHAQRTRGRLPSQFGHRIAS